MSFNIGFNTGFNTGRFGATLVAMAVAGSLSGCATYGSVAAGEFDAEDFGEANRQTYAAMIIDPDPEYDQPLVTSAEHAADAIERYREDAVKQPESVSTTEGTAGSGGN